MGVVLHSSINKYETNLPFPHFTHFQKPLLEFIALGFIMFKDKYKNNKCQVFNINVSGSIKKQFPEFFNFLVFKY